MGTLHANLVGANLHIAKIDVSTGTPTGSVTAAVIGQMYWDSVANKMYVAEQATDSDWVHAGIANDEFTELSDVDISTYVGKAGFHIKIKDDETGLDSGQALRTTDSPTFAAIMIGASSPFADVAGVLTLQNVDAIDATTETTLEAALDFVSPTGTPVNNQIAIWTGSDTLEGDSDLTFDGSNLATTGRIRAGAGTELLPTYSFTANTDRGMYDTGTSLRFVNDGFDVLELVSEASSTNFLQISSTDGVGGFFAITLVPVGSEPDIDINIDAQGGDVVIAGSSGSATIGSGGGIKVNSDGAIGLGQGSVSFGVVDGLTVKVRAEGPFTKSSLQVVAPLTSSQFLLLGVNDTGVNNGDAFITAGGTELVLSTSTGEALGISGLDLTAQNDMTVEGGLKVNKSSDVSLELDNSSTTVKLRLTNNNNNTWDIANNITSNKFSLTYNSSVEALSISAGGSVTILNNLTVNSGVLFVEGGQDRVGIGTLSPSTKLHVLGTTEQLRLGYDTSNYTSFTVSSVGDLTLAPTGSDTNITGNLSVTGDLTVDTDTLFVDSTNNRVGMGTVIPDNVLSVVGNFDVSDADTATKAYRFRTSGGSLDFEGGGADMFFSVWSGADFTGTQHQAIQLSSSGGDILMKLNTNFQSKNILNVGTVGIGTTSVSAQLHVLGITEQLRLGYDASNYAAFTVDSGGSLNIAPTGDLTVFGDQVSRLPSTVSQLFSTSDYEDLGSGSVITTTGTRSLRFHASVTSSTRHVISSQASELQFIDPTEGNQMIYTGSLAFITATDGGDITLRNAALIAATAGTPLFDYVGEGDLPGVDINEVVQSANLAQWDLGSIGRVSTGEVGPIIRFKDTNIISTTDPLILDSCVIVEITSCLFDDTAKAGSGGPLFSIKDSSYKEGRAVCLTNGGRLYSGESLVRIDAGLPDTYRVEVIDSLFIINSGGSIFDTSGSTGSFTAVADNSISATTITGVTDSSGVASFTVASAPLLGSLATISGFTTNTDYNTTGIVTARTATTFEIDYVAFGTTEAGSYLVTGVTVTSTAHGLTIGTGATLDTAESTQYDGGFLLYNIQTNSFDVPGTFTVTKTGTWSTKGLDQSDPRVKAFNNPETANSHAIACGFVNANSTATGTIVNNTFTDMVFGTSGSALIESSTTERWKVVGDVNGIFEYKGLDPFDGLITFDFTVESSGGTVDFRFKWQKSTDGGSSFSDLTDSVESLVAVGSDAQSVTKTFPLAMAKGDQIKPQITRNSGSSGITSTYVSIYITD